MSFFGFTRKMFKINSIKTLLYRAYHLSFSSSELLEELNFLKSFFKNNGYPLHKIETQINKFLSSMFSSAQSVAIVKKEIKYLSLTTPSKNYRWLSPNYREKRWAYVHFIGCAANYSIIYP